MQQSVEVPTPAVLADLVARCDQINRYTTQLTAAEEVRIGALAAGILVMRQVLGLELVAADTLPTRQGRIQHWALTGGHLAEAETSAIRAARAAVVLDEHEQVKLLSDRSWKGQWRVVTLWRNGEHGIVAAQMMEFLARLAALAHQRAPDIARALLARSEAIAASHDLLGAAPRMRGADGSAR